MKKSAWMLLAGMPALSGCISLADLNDESLKAGGPFQIVAERDPCPETLAAESVLLAAQPDTMSLMATSQIAAIPRSGTDLEIGRAILAAMGNAPAAAPGPRSAASGLFGMNLAQFADQVPLLTEEGAAHANATLDSVPAQRVAGLMDPRIAASEAEGPIALDRREMRQLFDDLAATTALNGWTASLAQSLGSFHRAGGFEALAAGNAPAETQAALQDIAKKYLLAAYFLAYFRNGAILRLEVLDSALRERIGERIRARIEDAAVREQLDGDVDRIVEDIRSQFCTGSAEEPCFAFGVIGDVTFVTRAGKSYGFPGITGQFTPLGEDTFSLDTPEWTPVIGDIVRIFVEASGDAIFAVPGAQNSTACANFGHLCGAPADAERIARVNESGDRIEASAKSVTSVAIRGGWLFSLNNEALATGIETLVSVSARKVAERAAWSRRQVCPAVAESAPHRAISFQLR